MSGQRSLLAFLPQSNTVSLVLVQSAFMIKKKKKKGRKECITAMESRLARVIGKDGSRGKLSVDWEITAGICHGTLIKIRTFFPPPDN